MVKRQDLYIRDPFIVPDYSNKRYYLFGTTDRNCWGDEKATGFDYYISQNLENFDGPFKAFRPDKNFWADMNFWAPEVHKYKDGYYMFATFIANGIKRGTQILYSPEISGPYKPHSPQAVTPENWMCLDGTLFVDEEDKPWIIYCHEWVDTGDGEIYAQKLSDDLKSTAGKPVLLFKASEAPWTRSIKSKEGKDVYVTDGPYLYKSSNNVLILLWSSFVEKRSYALGLAFSSSGEITGPWVHDRKVLITGDAGHGMVFKTFDGQLMLTVHTPNRPGEERPIFIKAREEKDRFILE
ncbi:MAG TPA: glycoside hydrolase family 43 protein [Halanaerobiales bacterium]|nr:glycoside hydrolase family 43 protein [Halanaerobiales bacterium]